MKHKYVPLTEITNDTLKEFNFWHLNTLPVLPDFKFSVTMHENLKRIDTDEDLRKSILIGICEVLVGTFVMHGKFPDKETMGDDIYLTDIPNDFGCSGKFEADYSVPNTVRILNLLGVQ